MILTDTPKGLAKFYFNVAKSVNRKSIFLAIVLLLFTLAGFAQVTSSGMTGKVIDQKGEAIPGAVVLATHVSTETKYPTSTDADGKYHLVNMNPGGPYTIKVTYLGYADYVQDNISVSLGENLRFDIKLNESSQQLAEVVVVSDKDDNKSGTGTRISREQIQTLPTLSRSMSDFTRLTPQSSNNSFAGTNFRYNNITIDGAVNNDAIGFSPSLGGVSGTSNMLSSSTRTNAMSLDAIQDMAVSIAPYDVRLGNFTGGSINAVTRRGTNDISASVYSFGRNAMITGPDNSGDKSKMPSNYQDDQIGFRIGLPLIKDKLFVFGNYEETNHTEPCFYMAGSSGSFMSTALAKRITDSLNSPTFLPKFFQVTSNGNNYGNSPGSGYNPGAGTLTQNDLYNPNGAYNPGAYNNYSIFSKSKKGFLRFDWTINDKHQLTLRNNFVTSSASNLEQSATQFEFGNYDFVQNNINNATVLELKSRFTDRNSNSLILGETIVHDWRNPTGTIFPQVQIGYNNGADQILLGTNREAGIFNMKQKTFEFTDNFTHFIGKHTLTFGTHNELYGINYGFINSWNGRYEYDSAGSFFLNTPSRIRSVYNLGDNSRDNNFNNPVAKFNVLMSSIYAQDEWNLVDNFKVTFGIRGDLTYLPTHPILSDTVKLAPNDPNYGNTYTHPQLNQTKDNFLGKPTVSPRIGFNWDVLKNKKIVIRGGWGMFTGRIPFAWLGYAYYNNGVNYGAFDYHPAQAFNPVNISTNPQKFAQYNDSILLQRNRVEVDVIDNKLKMPKTWRANLAVDFNLFKGYKLTFEGIYTKTIYDIMFKQINLKDSVSYFTNDPNHQHPFYLNNFQQGNRIDDSFSSAYLITNTKQGYRYQLTVQLMKEYKIGLGFMAAYTYGQSKDISNGIRNSPESNWQLNQSLSPNNPQLAYSNFDIRHRIIATLNYKKNWKKRTCSYISLIFSGQSGSPFTYGVVGGSSNTYLSKTGQQVDMFYIPKTQSDINFDNIYDTHHNIISTPTQQWTALNNYISNDPYLSKHRGEFTQRNAARTPWNNQLDFRFMQDIYIYHKDKKHTFQLTFDIINLTNLINPKWGWQAYTSNTYNSTVDIGLTGIKTPPSATPSQNAQGPFYNYVTPPTTRPYLINNIASRWQGQIGIRYFF